MRANQLLMFGVSAWFFRCRFRRRRDARVDTVRRVESGGQPPKKKRNRTDARLVKRKVQKTVGVQKCVFLIHSSFFSDRLFGSWKRIRVCVKRCSIVSAREYLR